MGLRQCSRSSGQVPCFTATQGPGEPAQDSALGPGVWGLGLGAWAVSKVGRDTYLRPCGHTGGSNFCGSTSSLRDTGCRPCTGQAPRGGRAHRPVDIPRVSLEETPPDIAAGGETGVLESGLTRDSPALNSPPLSSCLNVSYWQVIIYIFLMDLLLFIYLFVFSSFIEA